MNHLRPVFSRDEIREARSLFGNLGFGYFVSPGSSVSTTADHRITLASYYTSAARATGDIGLKIVNYCSALESLFASNPAELTHQLSERVAAFLEDDPRKRSELYAEVKKAYTIRSKVAHGSRSKPSKLSQFRDVSRTLDEILRRSYGRIFNEMIPCGLINLEAEEFDAHFLLRIFGASWEDLIDKDEN